MILTHPLFQLFFLEIFMIDTLIKKSLFPSLSILFHCRRLSDRILVMKKLLGIMVLGLLLSSNAYAECVQGNCKNGQGTYAFANGDQYVGEFKEGKYYGQGTYSSANGDQYVGEFKNDQKRGNGQGTYTRSNGDQYVGEFKNDQRHGQGTYTSANGKIKEGLWENDKLVREKSEIVRYEKIYNKCILENLKGQSDKEVIKIIKDACKNKVSDQSTFDKLFN
jgi:hypothetical protein